ncbi:2-oxoacid:acceptor oxidoreductase subunit alpha [Gudongella sp. DL1XJH-153]|uniref:2-oxoacid:acceptor oxidoreductase subunit alpha n=1 Tax=Gudongella sp. DL1XJH-153 TaxID=3409804 RepID=UPI003BB73AC6
MDYTILIGGAAGQGIETVVLLLEKTIKRSGYNVFTYKNYMSMVRGGHNFMQVRFSDKAISTYSTKVDMIFAMTAETVDFHKNNLKDDGVIILDEDFYKEDGFMQLPFKRLAKEIGNEKVVPTIGFGVIGRYFGLDKDIAGNALKETFKDKVLQLNLEALDKGFDLTETHIQLDKKEDNNIIINGNQALAMGAIAAGVKYYCGYPMTPSTSVMSYISGKSREMGIVVDQIEDEVGALNMALGASYAGTRAMTGSSGGGFALMVEALSLSGILEQPVVVVNAQRPGPATGLSTRTEQADLRFVIHAGHGEFPRMVITLRNPEDAFYQAARAFNIAEKYQIPVILMTEEYLTDYMMTTKPFDFSRITIERNIAEPEGGNVERYKRYKYTETGVSPRLLPGKTRDTVVLVDSHEHNEYGNIDESIETRNAMMRKRMSKLEGLRDELMEPEQLGVDNPEVLLVGFGATHGALLDAVERLNSEGLSVGALVFGDIWPFPDKLINSVGMNADKIITVEQNMTGQLESIILEKTRLQIYDRILKYDGRAINGDEIIQRLNTILDR